MLQTPTIHVGSPTQVGPLTLFPVWTDAPVPRHPLRARLPRGATIAEADGGAVVEQLTVHNPTTTAFLLAAGTVFAGGQQDRTLLTGVVVGAQSTLDLEVRCVEAGRWGGGRRHQLRPRRVPLAVRGALAGVDAAGPDRHDRPKWRGDQGEVWRRVALYQQPAPSVTGSVLPALDGPGDLVDALLAHRPLPGQRGVLVGIAGHPVLLEVFDHPDLLDQQWEAIATSLAADAAFAPAVVTPGRRARIFATHVSNRPLRARGRAGTAVAAEHRDEFTVIDALVDGDTGVALPPIHLTALNARHQLVRS